MKFDLTGQVFGELTVIKEFGLDKYSQVVWLCKCSCGNQTKAIAYKLRIGEKKSCGCREGGFKHGHSYHPLYSVWLAIKARCLRKGHPAFKWYGARGIKVYTPWIKNFQKFYDWAIGNGWKKDLQIDRIDNDGDYSPKNCRFVTSRVNMCNTRRQKFRELPLGVYHYGARYKATIYFKKKYIHVGYFDDSKSAANSRIKKLTELLKQG